MILLTKHLLRINSLLSRNLNPFLLSHHIFNFQEIPLIHPSVYLQNLTSSHHLLVLPSPQLESLYLPLDNFNHLLRVSLLSTCHPVVQIDPLKRYQVKSHYTYTPNPTVASKSLQWLSRPYDLASLCLSYHSLHSSQPVSCCSSNTLDLVPQPGTLLL